MTAVRGLVDLAALFLAVKTGFSHRLTDCLCRGSDKELRRELYLNTRSSEEEEGWGVVGVGGGGRRRKGAVKSEREGLAD